MKWVCVRVLRARIEQCLFEKKNNHILNAIEYDPGVVINIRASYVLRILI